MQRFLIVLMAACQADPEPQHPQATTIEWSRNDLPRSEVEPLPQFTRREALTSDDGVIRVAATPEGYSSWTLRIENTGDSGIDLVWDESSFVTAAGESLGRLIRGETRRMDLANPQTPTPLPSHAHMTQLVLVEKLADGERSRAEAEKQFEELRNMPVVKAQKLRDMRAKLIESRQRLHDGLVGATMRIAVRIGSDKREWVGTVSEAP